MKRISTGIENFKELLDNNYYYVDKTMLIKDALSDKVTLYTRPRRFGKTLNMSMLYYFFSNKEKENTYLFNNLKITKNQEVMKHQNKYPVMFLTFKDLSRETMEMQIDKFKAMVSKLTEDYSELFSSSYLSETEMKTLNDYRHKRSSQSDLRDALYNISIFLNKHYGKKVILLIDEYDVPLQSAYNNGYYDEMVDFLRSMFSSALKTNDALERGILTGCLRISKESIFTGLNNFTVRNITDKEASDCFGFTQKEIDDLLKYYDLIEKRPEIKDWYDGYLFGKTEIYNPWSALNYIKKLLSDDQFLAISFWANTSSNELVRLYIENATLKMKEEFEQLINGKSIIKKIVPELTYREMNFKNVKDMNDNVYSFLLFTGYLKIKGKVYDQEGQEYLLPLFEEVYEQAKIQNPRLSSNIKLFMNNDLMPNAFACASNTICVTKGAIQTFSREELQGILAHEFGHISNGDTKITMIFCIGNVLFMIFAFVMHLIYVFLYAVLRSRMGNSIFLTIINGIKNLLKRLGNFIVSAIFSLNSRNCEKQADYFAHTIGFGEELKQSLFLLKQIDTSSDLSIMERIYATHPDLDTRIARLEQME